MDFPSTTPENETTSKNEEKLVNSNVFDDNNVSVEEQLVDNNFPTEEKLEDNNGPEEPISNTLETEKTLQQSIHKSTQTKTMPKRFGEFELNFSAVNEPTAFEEVTICNEWKVAMQKEYDALIKNGTWRLVDPPIGIKPIGSKWIYKSKYKADGSLDKHKVRLVAKGYAQKEGIDYTETFAPTAKWGTIRTLFSLVAQKGWKIHHMDVKIAFLNGDLKEDVYMLQPKGFSVKGKNIRYAN
jgi:hypothetical protein